MLNMKTLLFAGLLLSAVVSAQAQLFSPESASGTFLGAAIGAAAAGCHNAGTGAAIGAGAGFLLGTLAHAANQDDYSGGNSYPAYSYGYSPSFAYYTYPRSHWGWHRGWGFGVSVGLGPVYSAPYYYTPTYVSTPSYPYYDTASTSDDPPPSQSQPAANSTPSQSQPSAPAPPPSPMAAANSLFGR